METVTTFSDIGRTTTGTKAVGKFARLQKTSEESLKAALQEVLDLDGFNKFGISLKNRARDIFIELPGAYIRNPTLGLSAILFILQGYNETAKDLKAFEKKIRNLKLSRADLFRYIRFVREFLKTKEK